MSLLKKITSYFTADEAFENLHQKNLEIMKQFSEEATNKREEEKIKLISTIQEHSIEMQPLSRLICILMDNPSNKAIYTRDSFSGFVVVVWMQGFDSFTVLVDIGKDHQGIFSQYDMNGLYGLLDIMGISPDSPEWTHHVYAPPFNWQKEDKEKHDIL